MYFIMLGTGLVDAVNEIDVAYSYAFPLPSVFDHLSIYLTLELPVLE